MAWMAVRQRSRNSGGARTSQKAPVCRARWRISVQSCTGRCISSWYSPEGRIWGWQTNLGTLDPHIRERGLAHARQGKHAQFALAFIILFPGKSTLL